MFRKRARGFTIVEMLVVLAIAGTCLSIAAYAYHSYQERTRLRSAIETMGAHIRQARWEARMQSAKSMIIFDVNSRSYTVNGKLAATLPKGIRFGADPSVTGKPGQPYSPPPADGISFDMGGSKNIARFYPTGAVSPTGSVFLTDGKATMAVTVAITGRPKLWRSCGGGKWESF